MSACPKTNCLYPAVTCSLGHSGGESCPEWKKIASPSEAEVLEGSELTFPWSGGALVLPDLGFLASRMKPLVIGVVGAESSGKSTLLAAWYVLLGQGAVKDQDRQFAGSFSLEGWEALANTLRWRPGQGPTFPPHTSSRSGRAPGLLHLGFRQREGRVVDHLFTDTPGEWFRNWTIDRDSVNAEGARWIAEHADAFLLMADREALSGPSRGTARGEFQLLAHRLGAERRGRPVALVWTKADLEVQPAMENAVRDAVKKADLDATEFAVGILAKEPGTDVTGSFLKLLAWTLDVRRDRRSLKAFETKVADPLFAFRGSNGQDK